jgi:hypothetical protein
MQRLCKLRDHFWLVRMIDDATHTVVSLILCLSIALVGRHITEESNFDAQWTIADWHLFLLGEISHLGLHLLSGSWLHLNILFHNFN